MSNVISNTEIDLGVYGIKVTLTNTGAGAIVSDLKEGHAEFDAAMDGIESMILAHAMAGVDVTTPEYLEGVETAVTACGNAFDDEPEVHTVIVQQNSQTGDFIRLCGTVEKLRVFLIEDDVIGNPSAVLDEDKVIHWSAMADYSPEKVATYVQALDKGIEDNFASEAPAIDCDKDVRLMDPHLTCEHCKAVLTEGETVNREYINKDGGESAHSVGHYDAQCNFVPDVEADLSAGRYDLADDSDTCSACEMGL